MQGSPVTLLSMPCPLCERETQMRILNIEAGNHQRTFSCQNCKMTIIFEYTLKPGPGAQLHRDPDWLREKYIDEDKTLQEVADMCGVSPMTIRDWLQRHKIPVRPRGTRTQ